jgi:hypothetical protein
MPDTDGLAYAAALGSLRNRPAYRGRGDTAAKVPVRLSKTGRKTIFPPELPHTMAADLP